jgi:hypothetical protein
MRELVRAPEFAVVGLATLALLLAVRAASMGSGADSARVHAELVIATVALVSSVYAVICGVRASSDGNRVGPTAQISASPLGRVRHTVARVSGIVVATTGAAGVALVLGATLGAGASDALATRPLALLVAMLGIGAQIALSTSIGVLAGSLAAQSLATVGSLLLLGLLRAGAAVGGSGEGAIRAMLPDPMRVEFARELAFGRPLGSAAVALGILATLLYAAALLALACARVRTSRRSAD